MRCRTVVPPVEGFLPRHLLLALTKSSGVVLTARLCRHLPTRLDTKRRPEDVHPHLLDHRCAPVHPLVLLQLMDKDHPLLLLDLGDARLLDHTGSYQNPLGLWCCTVRFRPVKGATGPHTAGVWVWRVVVLHPTDQLQSLCVNSRTHRGRPILP